MFVVLFLISMFANSTLSEVRNLFISTDDEKSNTLILEKTKTAELNQPELYAYHAISVIRQAEYSFFPHKKLEYFNKGKNKLEEAIKQHPANAEIRFIRLVTQLKTPSFVGYNKNIEEDKTLIKKAILNKKFCNNNEYTNKCIKFLAELGVISSEEKVKFTNLY